jgi:hypothetical protein
MLVCFLVSLSCLLTCLIVSTLAIAILQVGAGQAGEGGEEIRSFQPMQVLRFVGTRRKAKLSATFKLTKNSKAFCNMHILNYALCHLRSKEEHKKKKAFLLPLVVLAWHFWPSAFALFYSAANKQSSIYNMYMLTLEGNGLFSWFSWTFLEVPLYFYLYICHFLERHMMSVYIWSLSGFVFIIVLTWHLFPSVSSFFIRLQKRWILSDGIFPYTNALVLLSSCHFTVIRSCLVFLLLLFLLLFLVIKNIISVRT